MTFIERAQQLRDIDEQLKYELTLKIQSVLVYTDQVMVVTHHHYNKVAVSIFFNPEEGSAFYQNGRWIDHGPFSGQELEMIAQIINSEFEEEEEEEEVSDES